MNASSRQSRKTKPDRTGARPSTGPSQPGPTPALALAGFVALVAVLAVWAYAPSFKGVFIYDDRVAIVDNPNIRALWPLRSAMSAPAESPVSARPIAALTLAVNYALAPADVRDVMSPARPGDPPGRDDQFLRNVWGYHALNLLLHVLAALTLAGIVRRTLLTNRERFGAAALPLGFAVAALWVVHPLTTDAVTYVAQRTEVLMGLCYGLTLYCAIRAGESATSPRARRWWTAGAIAACAAGMGSKQTMVTAPIVVVIWDWVYKKTAEVRGVTSIPPFRSRFPLYLGLAATWLLLAGLVAYERWPTSIGFALEGWTPWTYLLTQTTVIGHYARLAVVGSPLALDYDGWSMSRSVVAVLPYALPLLALFVTTVVGVVRRRSWAFPAVVWFAALAPSSSLLPLATEIAAERRMYVPLAAFVAVVVVGAYLAGSRWLPAIVGRGRTGRVVMRFTAAAAVALTALTYGWMTWTRNHDFWSEERIWSDTVFKRPANSRARVNYGSALADRGNMAEAESQLREAVRLKDTSAPAHAGLGSVLCARGSLAEGIAHLERALAIDPDFTPAFHNLAEAYGALGDRARAARYFALAVDARPNEAFLLNRLGWLLATAPEDSVRDGAKAVAVAERAVQLTRRQDATSLDTLAAAYAEVDRYADAVAAAGEAIAQAERRPSEQALLPELRDRLARYQARQKYREPKTIPGPDVPR